MSGLTGTLFAKKGKSSTEKIIEVEAGLVGNRAKYFQALCDANAQKDMDMTTVGCRANMCTQKPAGKEKESNSTKVSWSPIKPPQKSTSQDLTKEATIGKVVLLVLEVLIRLL